MCSLNKFGLINKNDSHFISFNHSSFNSLLLDKDTAKNFTSANKTLFGRSKSNSFPYTKEQIDFLDLRIQYILELIGKYSNTRFGQSAEKQHAFFQRPSEQSSFLTYLFIAIQEHKKAVISKRNKAVRNEFIVPYLEKIHLKLRSYEGKRRFYFTISENRLTEKQLYAVGVIYMFNFIYQLSNEDDSKKMKEILNNLNHFSMGPSYFPFYGTIGLRQKRQKLEAEKEKAREIFNNTNLLKNSSDESYILKKLTPMLRRRKIYVSEQKIKSWLPEFLKK